MAHTASSLSTKRMVLSLLIFCAIPASAHLLNVFVRQYDIALMASMNTGGAVLIIYNWNLFGIHYNRAKENPADTLLFTVIAFLLILVWTWVGLALLKCRIIIPSHEVLQAYGYARPGMLMAYSIMEAAAFVITCKCVTDRFVVRHQELQTILLTGLLFGTLITFLFLPAMNILTIVTTLLYNVVLMTMEAYAYNQTHSFIPGMLGFAFSNLVFMLL